jgi:ABC-type glycerol-3-phosphate transport system substrate-binding protein
MWAGDPTELATWRGARETAVALAPFPVAEASGDGPAVPMVTGCVAISAGSAAPEVASLWVDYLEAQPLATRRWETPGRREVATASGYWDNVTAEAEPIYRFALARGWYGPPSPALLAVADALATAAAGARAEAALAAVSTLPMPAPIPTASGAPVIAPEPTQVTPSGEGIHIYIGYLPPGTVRKLIASFTAKTGIAVEADTRLYFGPDESFTLDQVATRNDCFFWDPSYLDIAGEALLPLQEAAAAAENSLLAAYDPAYLDVLRRGDDLLGLPVTLSPTLFYYNADRFARHDLAPPALNWTFETFAALAAEFPLGEGRAHIYGFVPAPNYAYGEGAEIYSYLAAGRGAHVFDYSETPPRVNFAAPETEAALRWLEEEVAAGIIAPYDGGGTRPGAGNQAALDEVIGRGNATMWNGLAMVDDSYFGWGGASFSIGIASPPDVGGPLPPPRVTAFYIGQHTEKVEACLALFRFFTEAPEAMVPAPAGHAMLDSDAWAAVVGEEVAAVYRHVLANAAPPRTFNPLEAPLQTWWQDAVAAVFAGADPAPPLAEAQAKADAYRACLQEQPAPGRDEAEACARTIDPSYPVAETP